MWRPHFIIALSLATGITSPAMASGDSGIDAAPSVMDTSSPVRDGPYASDVGVFQDAP
jgi:hypothetical protein